MYNTLKLSGFILILFTIGCNPEPHPGNQSEKNVNHAAGKLFIIGGGDRGDSLMMDMIMESGWEKGDLITAITLPSGWGDSAYIWLNDDFKRLTGQNCVKFDSAAVFVPAKIDSLRKSKIIFISGGDQNVMMNWIKGSEVKKTIQEAYKNGALIGGTSAGASIMSEHMITGNGLIDTVYESTFSKIWKGNLELAEGLGLLDSVIIDQHFIVRSRYNRLFSAIMENPDFQCIGINEATAILVDGDSAKVIGESQVFEISNPDFINTADDTLLSAKAIKVSVYLPGEKFRIKN